VHAINRLLLQEGVPFGVLVFFLNSILNMEPS
jgi:hypothetical protein